MPIPNELERKVPRTDLYDSFDLVHYHMPLEQPPATASYIIFKKGNKYYAKNGTYGHIEYEDTDAATVIQQAVDNTPEGGFVFVKGDVVINSTITITKRIFYEHIGTATLNSDYIQVGDANHWVPYARIHLFRVDGQDKANGYKALKVYGMAQSVVEFELITRCGKGIEIIPASSNVSCIDNIFYGGVITGCDYGIHIRGENGPAEGNMFLCSIFACSHGLYLEKVDTSAKYTMFIGVIDNADVEGSEDIKDEVGQNIFIMKFIRDWETYSTIQDTDLLICTTAPRNLLVPSAGIRIGPDIDIDREGANVLRLTDTLIIRKSGAHYVAVGTDPTHTALQAKVNGDTYYRFEILSDGKLRFGSGSSDCDISLFRDSANLLSLGLNDGLRVPGAIRTYVKAGAPTDEDIPSAEDGAIVIDSANGRIYFRYGGAWHYVAQTAGLELGENHKVCPVCNKPFNIGDEITWVIDGFKPDGSPHAVPIHKRCRE